MPRDPLGDLKTSGSYLAPGGGALLPGSVPAPWPMLPFLFLSTPHSLLIDIGITNQEVNNWNRLPTIRSQMYPEASVAILRLTYMTSLAPAAASLQKPSKPPCQKEKEPSLGD